MRFAMRQWPKRAVESARSCGVDVADDPSVDAYIATFAGLAHERLGEMRALIRQAAPELAETISYRIPAMTIGGKTVLYFAGWKHHISLYPAPVGEDPALEQQL